MVHQIAINELIKRKNKNW